LLRQPFVICLDSGGFFHLSQGARKSGNSAVADTINTRFHFVAAAAAKTSSRPNAMDEEEIWQLTADAFATSTMHGCGMCRSSAISAERSGWRKAMTRASLGRKRRFSGQLGAGKHVHGRRN